jgi:predicted nuclease of predicted toxin-antitoxin system
LNFVCDEGVERPIVEHLREHGHDVIYVAELEPGIPDEFVLAMAVELAAPVVTNDKDFGELVFRQQLTSTGVILLRLAGLSNAGKSVLVAAAVRDHSSELAGAFTVITPGQIRIRRMLEE